MWARAADSVTFERDNARRARHAESAMCSRIRARTGWKAARKLRFTAKLEQGRAAFR
jgi:hypothetical protein